MWMQQLGIVVLCSTNSLATSLATVYSKQQFASLTRQLTNSLIIHQWTEAFLPAGALFGCLLSWIPLRYLGRRATLQLVVAPLLTAGCCLAFVFHRVMSPVLLLGIMLQGAAVGVNFTATPIYIAETMCFPGPHTRTAVALMISTQLSAATGVLLANIFPISLDTPYLLLVPVAVAATSALSLCFVMESPRWLLLFGHRVEHAKTSLTILQKCKHPNYDISMALITFRKDEDCFCNCKMNVKVVRSYLDALLFTASLISIPYLSGVHIYEFYTLWIFQFADFRTIDPSLLSCVVRVAAVSISICGLLTANEPMSLSVSLIASAGLVSIALGATGLSLFSLEQGENWTWVVPWIPLATYLLFQTAFWFGVGSQSFVAAFQFTPAPLRPSIFSLAGGLHWLSELAANKLLMYMIDSIHPFGTFWLYAGTSAIGLVLIVFRVIPHINRKKTEFDRTCEQSTSDHVQEARRDKNTEMAVSI